VRQIAALTRGGRHDAGHDEVAYYERFLAIFSTKGAEKLRQHGSGQQPFEGGRAVAGGMSTSMAAPDISAANRRPVRPLSSSSAPMAASPVTRPVPICRSPAAGTMDQARSMRLPRPVRMARRKP
jgi:hypothetical protein